MPRKAESRADPNSSPHARSRTRLPPDIKVTDFFLPPKPGVPWERYTPLSARVYRLFPLASRLTLGRTA